MPFGNPIIGGGGALIRDAIRSPDYVAGSNGWTINRDGSAEFSDVTMRGTFATGSAGGPDAYLTIDDSTDRTTIDFWNAAGTNSAYINSPQATGSVPTLGLNTGLYDIGGGIPGRTRLFLQKGPISLAQINDATQLSEGGSLYLDGTQAILTRDAAGVANGGRFRATATNGYLEYASAGTGLHGLRVASDGIHFVGTTASDLAWSVAPASGFSIAEWEMNRAAGIVVISAQITRTGADLVPDAAGNIGDTTMVTVTSSGGLPASNRGTAGETGFGTYGVRMTSAGVVTVTSGTTDFATGQTLKFGITYWTG